MRRIALLVTVGLVLSTAAVSFVSVDAEATHLGTQYPDCENQVPQASSGSYDVGRLRASGYAGGTITGVDLQLVDQVTPGPDVFDPAQDQAQHTQVAGALVTLSMPGLQNTFLNDGPPTTEVAESAYPLDTGLDVHSGAQELSVIFTGEVTIHPPESFTCESTEDSLLWTFTIQKVELDGWATATNVDDSAAEPWGLGNEISIQPGDTSDA